MTAEWNKNKSGPKWGLAFFYLMIRLGGRSLAYFFLYFVVFAYVVFFPRVKTACNPYLTRRFPEAGRFDLLSHRYRLVMTFGRILVDRAVLGILGPSSIKAEFENEQDFHKIRDLDTGFIILTSHVGCWQVAMAALSRLNRPVNLLMLRRDSERDKHYFEHKNQRSSLKIIDPDQFLGGTLDMLEVLKKDEILCIMGDRLFGNGAYALDMDLLGGRAGFPFSAYKLASITQKPIVVLNSYKSGPAQYKLALPSLIHVEPKLGRKGENYASHARVYVDVLEQYAHDHPYQFFNFYDMWKEPAGFPAGSPAGAPDGAKPFDGENDR